MIGQNHGCSEIFVKLFLIPLLAGINTNNLSYSRLNSLDRYLRCEQGRPDFVVSVPC